jgi:hypothetical protein
MPDTKFEEASRCPTCGEPGKALQVTNANNYGDRLHHFQCDNANRCRHYQTGWVVQVSADGSIPTRQAGPKQFPAQDFSAGKRNIEQLKQEFGDT